jgi:hypothetical protein
MIVIWNIAIPLGVAFGPGEGTSLYRTFFERFRNEEYHIPLTTFTIERNRGSTLRVICQGAGVRHLMCVRHFLVALKRDYCRYQVGNLVKCRTIRAFEILGEADLLKGTQNVAG